jgi:hypothetical protein
LNVSPYDYTIRKAESLMNGFFTRIGISEVNFPWGIPNVNRKTQQIIVIYSFQGGPLQEVQITLPGGFYTPFELATVMQTTVRAETPMAAFTMTYGLDGCPRFTYDPADPDYAVFWAPLPYESVDYPFPNTTKQLYDLFGFSAGNNIGSSAGKGGYTFCQFTRYVDICCFQLTNNQALKDQTSQTIARDALCRVYLGDANIPGDVKTNDELFCPPGCAPFTIYRNFTMPKQIQWIPNQPIPGFLRFTVFDDSGTVLSEAIKGIINPADPEVTIDEAVFLDWSMTMLVSEN